jgi:uncharacterized protein YyaL (SSP411 family)
LSVDRVTAAVLERAAHGEMLSPAALTFLVRRYRAGTEPDVSETLGVGLAAALARSRADDSTLDRAEWLRAFTEALTVSEDQRLLDAARQLLDALSGEWHVRGAGVAEAADSVEACLLASHLVDPHELVPRAIDELERIVGGVYQPGQTIGDTADHVCVASALLTAFEISGRLPYSMLAEELVQTARTDFGRADFVTRCLAVRVLGRLAALHDDPSYRGAAVIKAEADYRRDAAQLLDTLSDSLADPHVDVACYGLALEDTSRSS